MSNPGFHKALTSGDTALFSPVPGSNFGAGVTFIVDGDAEWIGLIKFDLSAIPANATITSASLFLASSSGTSGDTISLHRLLRDWTELGATWNTYDGSNNWGTAGAKNTTTDYNTALLGTITLGANNTQTETSITASIVEDWVDGTNPNYGFRLTPVTNNENAFHSREAVIAARHPYMEVSYTYPIMVYEINSSAITAGLQANWLPISTGGNSDATQKLSTNWRRHIWTSPTMEMAEWLILLALRGTTITELKTTKESDPSITDTYSTGKLLTVTGRQIGRQMKNVKVEYLVDITS